MSDKPNADELDSLFSKSPAPRKDPFGSIGVNPATASMIAATEAVAKPPQVAPRSFMSTPAPTAPLLSAPEVTQEFKPPTSETALMTDASEDIILGEVISDQPIERFRGSQNFVHRIGIVAAVGKAVRTHYVDGMGSFYAIPGVTDVKLGAPTLRVCIPIVMYTTDHLGKVVSDTVSIRYLQLVKRAYDEFISANAGRVLDQCDYLVTCSDEKRQNLAFQNVGPSAWRKSPEFEAYVTSLYKARWPAVGRAVARTLTAQEFLAAMGEPGPSDPELDKQWGPRGDFNLDEFIRKGKD